MPSLADDNLDIAFAASAEQAAVLHCDPGEYVSTAYLGLVQAGNTFMEGNGASYRTMAYRRARGAIQDELRVERGTRRKFNPKFEPLRDFVSVNRRIPA